MFRKITAMFKNMTKNQKIILILLLVAIISFVIYKYAIPDTSEGFCGQKIENFGCPSCAMGV